VLQFADRLRCEDVDDRLEALIDGDLDPESAAAVEAHVARCGHCRAERQRAEEVRAALRGLPVFDAPPRVAAAFEAAVADGADAREPVLSHLRTRWVLAAAAAAAAALVITVGPQPRPRQPSPTSAEARRAADDTRLALAVLAGVTRRAEDRVRGRVLEGAVGTAVKGVSRSLRWVGETGGPEPEAARPPDAERS
jgi:anti-sigma factor RsiW